ncbi:MAG: ABC transporter ATP-binding protein uup [Spirochaetes bacterium ADurb.Bin215]|nr:MAG: ABC transporter ATP-binding protein uup [Spirochaetes bacterium ADurb.Bin215]
MFRNRGKTCYTPCMNLLSASRLTRHGRTAPLFSDISFGLDEGDKIALIGRNGCGKSTLLSCIAGALPVDGGTVTVNKNAGISWLPQTPVFSSEDTIQKHIFKSGGESLRIINDYEQACHEIATGKASAGAHDRLDAATREMDLRDLWLYEQRIRSVLTTLGITDMDLPMASLSGGLVKKVALAQVLVEDTRILLLDEPTNHLDLVTIKWLEDYLVSTDRAVFMVTHDRYFLDSVCTGIYELSNAALTRYEGNFSVYLEKKALAEEIAANTETRIESVLRKEREWLLRGPQARGTKARARVDAVHRMINREKLPEEDAFSFAVTGRRLGGKILEAENITKVYDGNPEPVISGFTYRFRKGERIGIFGNNGTGKTTLLNLLTETIPCSSGRVARGDNTVFGYFMQNPALSDTGGTVLEYISEKASVITMADGTILSASRLLERFGIIGPAQYVPLATLSGGERKRVYLVRLLMENPNFLVLDEPTNDFDIYTMSVLEDFLSSFAGCLVVVSHDRYFMDRTVESLFVLGSDGSISGFAGSCSEYLAFLSDNRKPVEPADTAKPVPVKSRSEKPKKRSFKEQKEFDFIEEEILTMEAEKDALEARLSSGESDHRVLAEISSDLTRISAEIEEKYRRWEYLSNLC